MKLPISKRLLLCASFVKTGALVADVGADHGYLGIHLIREGLAAAVYASDLREKPIAKARENAEKFGVSDKMCFFCAPGLDAVDPNSIDTVVCAGMGSDCIIGILEAARWLKDPRYSLILQPQSSGQDLRDYLGRQGFCLMREELVDEGGFLYTVLEARYDGVERICSPGELFLSARLSESGSPLLAKYKERLLTSLRKTLENMEKGHADPERQDFYCRAYSELA